MKQLNVFNYRGYGEYGCSKCNTTLVGQFTAIAESTDINGYKWRSFCPKCASTLKIANTPEVTSYIHELYEKYNPAPCL